jgi:AcrR family transcriptional regulator
MSKQQRLSPKERTEQILTAAVEVAASQGFFSVTRENVAAKAGCSVGIITLRFKTMPELRRAVMRRAVRDKVLKIIGQGVAAGDKIASSVPSRLRKQAVASLTA